MELVSLQIIEGSPIGFRYLKVAPRHLTIFGSYHFPHLLGIAAVLVNNSLQIGYEFPHFLLSFLKTVIIKSFSVCPTNISEHLRFEEKSHVGLVKRFLANSEPRSGLLIGMVEIDKRYVHMLSSRPEIVVIESTHFSAFVLVPLPKKLLLSKFKSPAVEQFLILVRSFFGNDALLPDFLKGLSFLLRKLLEFNIIEALVIEEFADDDIKVGMVVVGDGLGGGCLVDEGEEIVGQLWLGREVKHGEILVALAHLSN